MYACSLKISMILRKWRPSWILAAILKKLNVCEFIYIKERNLHLTYILQFKCIHVTCQSTFKGFSTIYQINSRIILALNDRHLAKRRPSWIWNEKILSRKVYVRIRQTFFLNCRIFYKHYDYCTIMHIYDSHIRF